MRISRAVIVVGLAALAGLLGCDDKAKQIDALHAELFEQAKLSDKLSADNEKLTADSAAKDEQVKTLQALGDKRLDKMFVVQNVDLEQYTGGVNTDEKDGDDAIRVYLQPMDQYGSVIKAAGSVKVQLYDLAMDPMGNLVSECEFPVDQVGKNWYGGFGAYHYSFTCPWKDTPKHEEITVRVEFIDYLTGKKFSAQKVCKVHLPPPASTQPSTQPTSKPASNPATKPTTQSTKPAN